MKLKRFLSVLLALSMVLAFAPIAAQANDTPQPPQTEANAPALGEGLRSNGTGSARAGSYVLTFQALGEQSAQYHDMKAVIKDAAGHELGVFDPSAYGAAAKACFSPAAQPDEP